MYFNDLNSININDFLKKNNISSLDIDKYIFNYIIKIVNFIFKDIKIIDIDIINNCNDLKCIEKSLSSYSCSFISELSDKKIECVKKIIANLAKEKSIPPDFEYRFTNTILEYYKNDSLSIELNNYIYNNLDKINFSELKYIEIINDILTVINNFSNKNKDVNIFYKLCAKYSIDISILLDRSFQTKKIHMDNDLNLTIPDENTKKRIENRIIVLVKNIIKNIYSAKFNKIIAINIISGLKGNKLLIMNNLYTRIIEETCSKFDTINSIDSHELKDICKELELRILEDNKEFEYYSNSDNTNSSNKAIISKLKSVYGKIKDTENIKSQFIFDSIILSLQRITNFPDILDIINELKFRKNSYFKGNLDISSVEQIISELMKLYQ